MIRTSQYKKTRYMEDEEMEFLNGIYKKEVTEWDELLGTSLLNQEVILEGAVHSIWAMWLL